MRLCTIGHGNLDLEAFISLLKENDVSWVADIRSAPFSQRFPWFNKAPLAEALEDAGVRYLFLGSKLGGKPREGESSGQWAQGKLNPALVTTLSRTQRWGEGLAYLAQVIRSMDDENETGCLLCSEKDPNNCHRSFVSFQLEESIPGLAIEHLSHGTASRETGFQNPLFEVKDERSHYH